jgi:hypothetical protein
MKNHTQFHDGTFDGLRIQDRDKGIVDVYLRTSKGQRTTVVLTGVVMLNATGFKAGNIIFEVLTRDHNEVTAQDITELYDLQPGHEPESWEKQLMEKVGQEALQILEINPSYGARCLVLARTMEFRTDDHDGRAALA